MGKNLDNEPEDIATRYETWLGSWASDATIRSRVLIARNRLNAWGLAGFTADNIAVYLSRRTVGSDWTRTTYHAHLSCFCAWMKAAGHLSANPMMDVRKPRRPSSTPRPLTEGEVNLILSSTTGRTRDWLVIALSTGLRAHEIAQMRGEDVNADGIRVRGKGNKTVTLPCHPDVWTIAQEYPRHGYWFPGRTDGHIRSNNVSMTVSRRFTELGIDGSIHRCRHTYGTRLLRSGVNMRIVQKLMRHSNLATTATYTAVDEDELRDAIFRLPAA